MQRLSSAIPKPTQGAILMRRGPKSDWNPRKTWHVRAYSEAPQETL